MFRVKNIPMLLLALLMLVLVFFQAWTFYLGTTDVTFKRLLKSETYQEIEDISLRRYKDGVISPHLFTITSKDENLTINNFSKDCKLKKITIDELPKEADETDSEMVDVIKKSPYIYLSKKYDLKNPKESRMCLLFRDKEYLYLFINGNI